MKKILSLALVVVMLFAVVALAGCGKDEPALKFGMGVVANSSAKDAAGGSVITTAVAVLLDAENKIVAIDVDSADIKTVWNEEGKTTATEDVRTKYELGKDYGMSTNPYSADKNGDGKVLEWNEQVDAFIATVKGKSLDEVKAFMAEDGFAQGDLATAGCTIGVADFVKALEKAINKAADSTATAEDKLNLAIVSSTTASDATEEKDGSFGVDSSVVATVVNAEGKVVVAATDCVSSKFAFDTEGVVVSGNSESITSKLEAGADYGMGGNEYAPDLNGDGKVLEWNEQAAAFNAALVGKTATEIAGLAVDTGYGSADLQTAGCTIAVKDMVAAAVKAATVA